MGFAIFPEPINTFKWSDLDGKVLMIRVAQPNPECLEPLGQVYGMDEKGTIYILHEFGVDNDKAD